MIKLFSNISTLIIGYFGAPKLMLSASWLTPSQSVIDEAFRCIFSLLLAIISRVVFRKLEKLEKRRKARKYSHIKPEPQPETITLNSKQNEKEIS